MSAIKLVMRIFLLLMLTLSSGHAATIQKFNFPPDTQSWWVSQGTIHNGQVLYIKRFKSNKSVDSVIDFYKSNWKTDSEIPDFMESAVNGWRMISQLKENQQLVVQVQSSLQSGGSEGMISLMPLGVDNSGGVRHADKFTPMMRGGELISTTYSNSPTTAKTQTQIFSGHPSSIAARLKHYVKGRGWSLQDEYSHKDSVTQRFESAKRQLDVALVRIAGSKTLVFISEVAHASK